MLRIYGVARTRVFRVLWIAKELGLQYEHIPVEIGAAGARKPDYLSINPNGRLPATISGRCMRCACRLRTATPPGATRRSKYWSSRSRCSMARSPIAHIF